MVINKETQAKYWSKKPIEVIQLYWGHETAINRSIWLADQLNGYEFNSVLEAGCFSGRNIKYIMEKYPKAKVSGIDINDKAIEFAKKKLPEASLYHMNLHNVNILQEKFDIIFTCGVLIHIPPSDLRNVIEKFVLVGTKTFIHLEQIGHGEVSKGPKELKPNYKISDQIQWDQDIGGIYESLGFEVSTTDVPEELQTNGARQLVIARNLVA